MVWNTAENKEHKNGEKVIVLEIINIENQSGLQNMD